MIIILKYLYNYIFHLCLRIFGYREVLKFDSQDISVISCSEILNFVPIYITWPREILGN